jgi:hypothetical protein
MEDPTNKIESGSLEQDSSKPEAFEKSLSIEDMQKQVENEIATKANDALESNTTVATNAEAYKGIEEGDVEAIKAVTEESAEAIKALEMEKEKRLASIKASVDRLFTSELEDELHYSNVKLEFASKNALTPEKIEGINERISAIKIRMEKIAADEAAYIKKYSGFTGKMRRFGSFSADVFGAFFGAIRDFKSDPETQAIAASYIQGGGND